MGRVAGGTVALAWSAVSAARDRRQLLREPRRRRTARATARPPPRPSGHHLHRQRPRSRHPQLHRDGGLALWTATSGLDRGESHDRRGDAFHRWPPRPLTPAAGGTDNLTITAKDAHDNTVTTYTGSHSPDLLRRRHQPGRHRADGLQQLAGRRSPSARATAIAFTSRRGGGRHLEKRRDEALQGRASQRHRHRRLASPTPTAAGDDGRPLAASEIHDDRRIAHPGRGRHRRPDDHRPGHLRQHHHHLHGLALASTFSGASRQPRRHVADGRPTRRNRRSTSARATAITFTAGVATVASGRTTAR